MGGAGRAQAHPIDGCTLTVELQKFDILYTNILPSNVSVIAINIFTASYTVATDYVIWRLLVCQFNHFNKNP